MPHKINPDFRSANIELLANRYMSVVTDRSDIHDPAPKTASFTVRIGTDTLNRLGAVANFMGTNRNALTVEILSNGLEDLIAHFDEDCRDNGLEEIADQLKQYLVEQSANRDEDHS